MTFGILEPSGLEHVPGTVVLDEVEEGPTTGSSSLRHGRGDLVILVPQPTDDPNDPLNWSLFEKYMIFFIICLGTLTITVTPQPLLNAGLLEVSADLGRSLTDVTKLGGYLLLATGISGPFASAVARKFGRRPVYVAASIIGLIGCIVCECAHTYTTLLVGRVIQGIGASTYESIIVASIGDLFFVHERGSKIAIAVFLMTAISNGVSIIAGVITKNLGWPYNFHILLPFIALQMILCILFVPETMYVRESNSGVTVQTLDTKLNKSTAEDAQHIENTGLQLGVFEQPVQTKECSLNPPAPVRRKSFIQRLAVYNGVFTDDSIFKMLLACPAILLNLAVSYSVFVSGTIIAWLVAVAMVSSLIFSSPPYDLTAAGVGYASTGPLIGGLLGTIFIGLISDRLSRWMSRKNLGVYEPEFRIPPMIIGLVFSVSGLCGLGHSIKASASLYLLCFVWGVMLFGMTIVASVTTSYVLDAFPRHRVENYVMNMLYKNFIFYGVSNFMVDWYTRDGPGKVFDILGGITAALCLISLPMYMLGKKYRAFWGRYNMIHILHLETRPDPGESDS